jgi:hypothetical protein
MATNPLEPQYSAVAKAKAAYEANPTLSTDNSYRTLKKQLSYAQGAKASTDWYGPKGAAKVDDGGPKPGIIGRAIDILSVPTYAAAGAAKSILGQSDKGFVDTVNSNMFKDKDLFGDVLSRAGLPDTVSAIGGFALDVGVGGLLDPLSAVSTTRPYASAAWKLGAGAKRAGTEGALAATKTIALEKASGLARLVPGFKGTEMAGKLFSASERAATAYDKAIGTTFLDLLDEAPKSSWLGPDLLPNMEAAVKKIGPKSTKAWDFFIGQPGKWFENSLKRDQLESMGLMTGGKLLPGAKEALEEIAVPYGGVIKITSPGAAETIEQGLEAASQAKGAADDLAAAGAKAAGKTPAPSLPKANVAEIMDSTKGVSDGLKDPVSRLHNSLDQSMDVANSPKNITVSDDMRETAQRFMDEFGDEITMQDLYSTLNDVAETERTGLKGYDLMISNARKLKLGDAPVIGGAFKDTKFKNVEYLKEILGTYSKFITLFTTGKVGFSTASRFNSWLGNPHMAGMEGRNVTNPEYYRKIKDALQILRGKGRAEIIDELRKIPGIAEFAKNNPKTWSKIFGFKYSMFDTTALVSDAIKSGDLGDMARYGLNLQENIIKDVEKIFLDVRGLKTKEEWQTALKDVLKSSSMDPRTAEEGLGRYVMEYYVKHQKVPPIEDVPLSYLSNMLDSSDVMKWKTDIARKAQGTGASALGYKALNWYLTKPMENFELADHAFRLGQFMQDTQLGLTSMEIDKLRRFYRISSKDIAKDIAKDVNTGLSYVERNGQRYYRFTPEKAAEIASGTYMNYAAMPAAIKVLRSVPILGSPFAAFGYSMLGKTAQTAVFNPTYFAKAQAFMKEASLGLAGPQTPGEKEALQTNQAYLNNPFMLRLPRFFEEFPVFVNMKNPTPFLSNLLSPNERSWSNTFKGNIGNILDSDLFMKDPFGQWLASFALLPFFVEDGESPQNIFGTPLYPKDTPFSGKAGYAARDLAESVVPAGLSPLAFLVNMIGPDAMRDPKFIDNFPLAKYRGLAYALQGKSSVGAGTKLSIDNPAGKGALKTVGELTGASLNTVYPKFKKTTTE